MPCLYLIIGITDNHSSKMKNFSSRFSWPPKWTTINNNVYVYTRWLIDQSYLLVPSIILYIDMIAKCPNKNDDHHVNELTCEYFLQILPKFGFFLASLQIYIGQLHRSNGYCYSNQKFFFISFHFGFLKSSKIMKYKKKLAI